MKALHKRIAALALILALVLSLAAAPASAIEIIRVTGPTAISQDTLLPEEGEVIASDEVALDEKEDDEDALMDEDDPAGEELPSETEEETPAAEDSTAHDEKAPDEQEKPSAEDREDPADEEPEEPDETPDATPDETPDEDADEPLDLDGEFVVQAGVLTQYRGKGPAVVIPEGVTQISGKVFQNNTAITSVTLPATLEELPRTVGQRKAGIAIQGMGQTSAALGGWQVGTFAGCTALTSIHAPAHLQAAAAWELAHKDLLLREQGRGAYSCAGYLGKNSHIVFPEDVIALTDGKGITGNAALTAVTFEGVVADIPIDFFSGCSALTRVEAPEGCGLTLDHFFVCESITYAGLPKFVQDQPIFDIEDGILFGYHGLERDVVVPEGVTEVSYPFRALEGSMTTITLPSTLKTLRPGALQSYFGIKKLVLPDDFPLLEQDPDILSGLAETALVTWNGQSKDCAAWRREIRELQQKLQESQRQEEAVRKGRESAIASLQDSPAYQERLKANRDYIESDFGGLGRLAYKYSIVTDDIQTASDAICAGLTTDLEKVTALHDWVTENIYYNYPALRDHSVRHDKAQEAYETRTCVCEGYSILMQALCTAQDIPAVVALGMAGGYHAWNAIEVDGEWLWMDATWDTYNAYHGADSWNKGSTRKTYFLCSTEFISTDHSVCSLSWSSDEEHNNILSRIGCTRSDIYKNLDEAAYFAAYLPTVYPTTTVAGLSESLANEAGARRINAIRAENGLPAAAFSDDYTLLYYDLDYYAQATQKSEAQQERQREELLRRQEQQEEERQEQQKQLEEQLDRQYLEELKGASAEDMGVSDWAKNETVKAIENDLVPQDMRNSYTETITRLDFCRLVVRMAERTGKVTIPRNGASPFADVTDPDVTAAYALGIVKGTSATTFSPCGRITRQEAATMLARAADLLGCPAGEGETFADAAAFADWGREGIARISGLIDPTTGTKVMQGTGGGSFTPLGSYTREQAVVTMQRLFNACTA